MFRSKGDFNVLMDRACELHSRKREIQLLENGFKLFFEDKACLIIDPSGQKLFRIKMQGKSFSLNPKEEEQIAFQSQSIVAEIWHKRLGHFHHKALLFMQRSKLVNGSSSLEERISRCKACLLGKQTRFPFKSSAWKLTKKLQLIHTDLCGPQRTPTLNGSRYYIIFIDDLTRMCWIYFMKFKSEVAGIFMKFKAWIENQSGCKIQVIRSDNGLEYTSDKKLE